MASNGDASHAALYKHSTKGLHALRKNRENVTVALRKARREEQLSKRRNLSLRESSGVRGTGNVEGTPQAEPSPAAVVAAAAANLRSGEQSLVLAAARNVRQLLSRSQTPPIAAVIQGGLVQELVALLDPEKTQPRPSPEILYEAVWALTNVASGTTEETRAVVEAGAVPHFLRLIAAKESDLVEQAIWALGNIAGDSRELRDLVLGGGIVPLLLPILSDSGVQGSLRRQAVWVASNLCRGKPPGDLEALRPLLPSLVRALGANDAEVRVDAAWALSYVCDGENERIQAVLETGAIPILVPLLLNSDGRLVAPALRALGNVVTGTDAQTEAVVEAGTLRIIGALITHPPKTNIRKEALWLLSNVLAGTREQIGAVLEAGLVPSLISVLSSGDYAARKEAAYGLSNLAMGGSPAQIREMASAVNGLCDLLTVTDPTIVEVSLTALQGLLDAGDGGQPGANPYANAVEECGGLDKIEFLQNHASEAVYNKAFQLIQQHFSEEEEDASLFQPDGLGEPFNPTLARDAPKPALPPNPPNC